MQGRWCVVLFILLMGLSANALASGQVGNDASRLANNGKEMKSIRILITYQSKYGSTKQYAEWIHQETKGDLIRIEDGDPPDLSGYDILIIGGSVRMGKIVVAPFLQDHWGVLKGKKIVLFTTSITPPGHPRIQTMYEKSLPEEIRKEIRYFPFPGRISMAQLTLLDKKLVAIGKMMEEDETLKGDMGKDIDGVRREHLLPLFEYVKEMKTAVTSKRGCGIE